MLKQESNPEKGLWVNLSPYEKNDPASFGATALGRDLYPDFVGI